MTRGLSVVVTGTLPGRWSLHSTHRPRRGEMQCRRAELSIARGSPRRRRFVTVRADDGSPLVSNSFNPFECYPNQNKIGDYITIVSDHTGGHVAYAATFNFNPNTEQHEEDVYYVRVFPRATPSPRPTPPR